MHIYIDESGTFNCDSSKDAAFSCIGAVICCGRTFTALETEFKNLTDLWPKEREEIKGRLLDEGHVADLCALLVRYQAIFECKVIDMNLASHEEMIDHKKRQAELITANLKPTFNRQLITDLEGLKQTCQRMSLPLYVQYVLLTRLAWKAIQYGTLYWVQRMPAELANFKWVIDAKDREPTEYEKWWHNSVGAFLESTSTREPMVMLKGADYSAFTRHFKSIRVPQHHPKSREGDNNWGYNLGPVFRRDLTFGSSQEFVGLQMVDVLTNAMRRALSGRLGAAGWRPLLNLMINNKAPETSRYVRLAGASPARWADDPIAHALTRGNLAMIAQTPLKRWGGKRCRTIKSRH